jgi:two-component system, sensor histidine kinase and response regulator
VTKSPFIEEIKKIMDSVKMPIIIYDGNEDINLFVNKCFVEEIGYTKEEIPNITKWHLKAYPDEHYRNEIKKNWEKLLEEAQQKDELHAKQAVRIRAKNGMYRWYEIHRNVVGTVDVITYNNVDDLYKKNEQLASYNEQIKMLLSIISHDVRTPLGVLKNLVDSYSSLDLSKEEMKDMFSSISQEIDQTFQLINGALLWISSKNETFSFHEEAINLHHFFSRIKENYLAACKEKNITIKIDPDKNINISYDTFILEVVARNIINNAVKFCFENGIISVIWNRSSDYTDIYIKDDGPGMSKEKIDNILLNREDSGKQKDSKKGFGVGLKIINQCLRKYHGEMMIGSGINQGTSVTVRIPVLQSKNIQS